MKWGLAVLQQPTFHQSIGRVETDRPKFLQVRRNLSNNSLTLRQGSIARVYQCGEVRTMATIRAARSSRTSK